MRLRIGQGIDAHRFAEGGRLVLGGVAVPHGQGLAAHSDGDCLLHAIIDALLGAAGLGDIGHHFPDTDPANRGVDSRHMLRHVISLLHADGWMAGNVDATVVAERPRLAPYIDAMADNVASDLAVPRQAVSIKATTTERMGFTGRGEGIAALAVVLLEARP